MTATDPKPPFVFLQYLVVSASQVDSGSRLKKIRIEMTLRSPRSLVSSSYVDPALFKERQENFTRYEVLEGTAGQSGAKYRVVSTALKQEIEHVESLDVVSLPEKVVTSFQASHGSGQTINAFEEIDVGSTRWTQETEFEADAMPFIGRMFIKGIMKATARREMERFRKFVEFTAGSNYLALDDETQRPVLAVSSRPGPFHSDDRYKALPRFGGHLE